MDRSDGRPSRRRRVRTLVGVAALVGGSSALMVLAGGGGARDAAAIGAAGAVVGVVMAAYLHRLTAEAFA